MNDGRYGFKTVAEIPRIVNGYGTPTYGRLTIGKEWEFKGQRLSYANASCPDGRLQAKGQFRLKTAPSCREPCSNPARAPINKRDQIAHQTGR